MYTEVDVFVSNFTLIDPEIYQLWIEGCSCKFLFKSSVYTITYFTRFVKLHKNSLVCYIHLLKKVL